MPQVKAGSTTLHFDAGGAVAVVEGQFVAGFRRIAKMGRVPADVADQSLGVGIEQQLVGVEAVAVLRVVGAMDPVGVDRAGPRIRQVAVPDFVGEFRQLDALQFRFAGFIEQAELHLGRVGREQGEVDAKPVPGGPERKRQAFADA
ncbi:hypothetical protein M2351_006156 [Azospirillum canadense]|nr:hypothetical protein [Azospirillum canadense]